MNESKFQIGDLVGSTQKDMETHMGIIVRTAKTRPPATLGLESAQLHEIYWFFGERSMLIPVLDTFLRKIE